MPADIAAAQLADSRGRRWYADPLFKGSYPDDVLAELGADAPVMQPGDLAAIAQPMDYLGVNYYTRSVVSASGEDWKAKERGLPVSDMDWEIYPQGLTDLLCLLHRDYPGLPPVYVTENGGAFKDDTVVNGRVQDDDRTAYLRDHIAAVASAMQQGVPMAGYMVWSLMDNFEWASGYLKRFGIVHVDYATQVRTPKASADWYRDFIARWRG
jgi:beta-glucosidase